MRSIDHWMIAIISSCVIVTLAILHSSALMWVVAISAILGILASVFTASGIWVAYLMDSVSFGIYMYTCYGEKYYGEMVLSGIIIILEICTIIEWIRHKEKNVVIVNKISKKSWIISLISAIILTIIYALILYFTGSNLPILNALGTCVYIFGVYLAFRRSILQFVGYLSYEVIFFILWATTAIQHNYYGFIYLVGGITETILLVLGIFNWKKFQREQSQGVIDE